MENIFEKSSVLVEKDKEDGPATIFLVFSLLYHVVGGIEVIENIISFFYLSVSFG